MTKDLVLITIVCYLASLGGYLAFLATARRGFGRLGTWMLLAATYLGLQLFHRNRSVGAFVLPFVIAVFALAQGPAVASPSPPPAQGPLLALHITLNVLGY